MSAIRGYQYPWDVNPPRDEKRRAIVAKWQELTAQRAALEQEYARESERLSDYGRETARTAAKIHEQEMAERQQQKQRGDAQAAVNIAAYDAQQAELERRRRDVERITGLRV